LVAFGAGKQIEAHIELHLSAFPTITHCSVVNRSQNDRLRGLIARLQSRYQERKIDIVGIALSGQLLDDDQGLDANPANVKQLVMLADIICTATSATAPLLPSSWVTPGTHINLVGSFTPAMHEVDTELIKRAGRVVVDSREACVLEAGELIKAGLDKSEMVEMGEVVRVDGHKDILPNQARIDSVKCGDITIFKQVGISLLDVAIANAVLVRAESLGLGTCLGNYDSL
jgi:ornithine cyclodeaminase